jgi:hypothetical protein
LPIASIINPKLHFVGHSSGYLANRQGAFVRLLKPTLNAFNFRPFLQQGFAKRWNPLGASLNGVHKCYVKAAISPDVAVNP